MDAVHTPVMGDDDRDQARSLSLHGVRPPVRVPGYEQEAFVGKGAYGEVWAAVDSNSGRKVAIKYYTRRGGTDWAALAREVEKLRYLFSDRHVVQLFKVGWEAEPPYYVMEYMENGSLEDLLRHGPLPVGEAVALFREIAQGLVHAHNRGILHCDLKPANVLLDHDHKPRLADFGQSRLTNDLSPALGTLFYMAPEQADLKAAPDARWDVYALGAVMYRMLTGHPPHRGESGASGVMSTGKLDDQLAAYRHLIETSPPPAAHARVPGVDAGLAAVVSKCLAANPRNRHPNPQAVLADLDAWGLGRIRRPLLKLTGFGFASLLAVMGVVGALQFRDAVSTAEREVVARAVEGNRFAAQSGADRFGVQVQYRWQVLEHEARDARLRDWLKAGPDALRAGGGAEKMDEWLGKRKARYDALLEDAAAGIWFADARDGTQCATAPPFAPHRFQYRGYRDYFHGLGKELDPDTRPAPPPITRPHRSIMFRRKGREREEVWTVAFTVPVWATDAHAGDPLGVLGLTLDLTGQTRIDGDGQRFSTLIDTRADATGRRGLIVRHPYLDQYPATPAGDGNVPLHYADDVVKWADGGDAPFAAERGYQDPVGGEYAGTWLASPERVMVRGDGGKPVDTGWVVLVQERRDEVMSPVRELQTRLMYGTAAAATFVCVLVLVMWAGMMSVVDTSSRSRVVRFLRRWAKLPAPLTGTGTSGTTTGRTAGSGTGASIAVSAEPTAGGSKA